MVKVITYFHFLLLLPGMIKSQSPKTSETTLLGCTFIVRSCKSRCNSEPSNYVRWTVSIVGEDVTCQLRNPTTPEDDNTGSVDTPFINTFDVPCCYQPTANLSSPCPTLQCSTLPPIICPQTPCPETRVTKGCPECSKNPCPTNGELSSVSLDDKRLLHTLFILGVATLTSILLMCMFIFLGLVFYRKKNRSYRLDGSSEENQSLSKEKAKTLSTTLTLSDCQDNNTRTPSSSSSSSASSHNLPPRYLKTTTSEKKLNNKADYENTEQVGCSAQEMNRLSMQEYINHEDLLAMSNIPRSIQIKKENFEVGSGESASPGNAKVAGNNKPQVSGDFEIRGGFIQPKRTSTKSETQPTRFSEPDETNTDISLSDDIALHLETTQHSMSLFPELTDETEDPYVQSPPIRSPRNQTKFDTPDDYQTLMTNNPNPNTETNEYNILLHNSSVANNDVKALLFMNNNSHQQAGFVNSKSEVTLKPTPNINAASEV